MLHVGLLKSGVCGEIGVVGIVPSDRRVVGDADAVAGIGQVRVHRGLRAVFGHGITVEDAAAGAEHGRPADHGDCDHRLRSAGLAVGHDRVRRLARRGGIVGIAFKIIIGPFAVGIDLPIIGRFFVSARPVHGEVQVGQFIGGGKRHAVDQGADRAAITAGVDADEIGGIRPRRRVGSGIGGDIVNPVGNREKRIAAVGVYIQGNAGNIRQVV